MDNCKWFMMICNNVVILGADLVGGSYGRRSPGVAADLLGMAFDDLGPGFIRGQKCRVCQKWP